MGINIKQLLHKEYDEDRQCKAFVYDLELEDSLPIRFQFKRRKQQVGEMPHWHVEAVLDEIAYSTVFQTIFTLPKNDMSLEMVAAFGLAQFQYWCKQQVQRYSNIDFSIGSTIGDMYG